jgi:diguanylate cyclase (GGDEF)-like protein
VTVKKPVKAVKKKSKNQPGLSRRIVSMTVIFDAFFLIVVMAALAFIYVENVNREKENNALLLSENAISGLETFVEETKADALRLSTDEDVIAYARYLNEGNAPIITNQADPDYLVYSRFLATIKAYTTTSDSMYDFIFIASETTCPGSGEGCFVGVDEVSSGTDWEISGRPWYQDVQESTEEVTISRPYVDAVSQDYSLTFVAKILDGTDTIGYLGVDIYLSSFADIISAFDPHTASEGQEVLLFTPESEILFYSDADRTGYEMALPAEILALDETAGYSQDGIGAVLEDYGNPGTIGETELFGNPYYVIYADILGGWRVAVLVDHTAAIGLELTFILLTVLVVILMITVSLVLGRRIKQTLSPITDILDTIEEIKKGHFDVQVKVKENNELKNVADAINIMSKEIGSQMDLVYNSFLFDSLTGLKNRRACHAEIEKDILTGNEKSAICLIAVDNLKNINVTKGQSVGDELLQEFAHQLASTLQAPDYVYSNGGNEFIFILPKVKGLDVVERELLRIFEKFHDPITIKNLKVEVRCSTGVAIYPYDGRKMDDLIKKCDTALFKAKQAGNAKFVFYNDQITREVNYKAQINEQLAESIEKGQLYLKYQPLIDNKNEIYGFEALARWNSPTLGEIGPQVFISNAEESHLIIPIGTWILRQACLSQVEMLKRFGKQFIMSVNVSPVQILQKDFIDVLKKVIMETDIDPHYLVLEITEGILIDSTIYLEETINYIHEIGAKIALDDFGTGYASLTYLRKLPFDNLKIDKSFVDGIFSSKKDHSIIGTIVQLVHNLNMIVIAEGVETRKQYEFLKQITTDVFQGFLFSQALDLESVSRYVDQFYKVNKQKRIDVFANKDYTE